MNSVDNATKQLIVDRLFAYVGVCTVCGRHTCRHIGKKLPDRLSLDTVLRAINLDEHFFKEETKHE